MSRGHPELANIGGFHRSETKMNSVLESNSFLSQPCSSDGSDGEESSSLTFHYALRRYDGQRNCISESIPTPSEQKLLVDSIWNPTASFGQDEIWFLIDHSWLDSWKTYVSNEYDSAISPGPIDNTGFLDPSSFRLFEEAVGSRSRLSLLANANDDITLPSIPSVRVLPGTCEGIDFEFVPETVWNLLFGWYGGAHQDGYAPTVARGTIHMSICEKNEKQYSQFDSDEADSDRILTGQRSLPSILDVYPLFLNIALFQPRLVSKEHEYVQFCCGKNLTLDDVMQIAKEHFGVKEEEIYGSRFWRMLCEAPMRVYGDAEIDMQLRVLDEGEMDGGHFVIELKTEFRKDYHLNFVSNLFEKERDSLKKYGGSGWLAGYPPCLYPRIDYSKNSGDSRKGVPGVIGLKNLRNTCFMNSGLQCLTKTRCLKEYFTSEKWKEDLNTENPLGYKGEVAQAFADMMKMTWSGDHTVVAPRGFKSTIGKFNATFQGYRQEDSHELVSFLLDGCHEDLNRVKEKPATKPVHAQGRSDEIVAQEAWEGYKLRNDSEIVDHFVGQLRSETECPFCHKVSVTFDPCMYLQVPIPGVETRSIDVRFVYAHHRKTPIDLRVEVPRVGQLDSLRLAISGVADITAKSIAICSVVSGGVSSFYSDGEDLDRIRPYDVIYAFELLENVDHDRCHDEVLPFAEITFHPSTTSSRFSAVPSSYDQNLLMDCPVVVSIENGVTTAKEIYDSCLRSVLPFLKDDAKTKLLEIFDIDLDDPTSCFVSPTKDELRIHFTALKLARQDAARVELLRMKREEERLERYWSYQREVPFVGENQSVDEGRKILLEAVVSEPLSLTPEEEAAVAKAPDSIDHPFHLFDVKVLGEASCGSSSQYASFQGDWVDLFYTSHQKISVSKPERQSGLLGYRKEGSFVRIRVTVADFFQGFVDELKMSQEKESSLTPTLTKKNASADLDIHDCIRKFCEREILTKENTVYCDACEKHVQASKKFDIWKLPEVLVIQIKRFTTRSLMSGGRREKNSKLVEYPLVLDMSQHTTNLDQPFGQLYDLYGVSVHLGNTLESGHYQAYVKAPADSGLSNQTWYDFNDSYASRMSKSDVVAVGAYLLFYEARKPTSSSRDVLKMNLGDAAEIDVGVV